MRLPALLIHAKYLHGVPSQSIPAAPSVLLLWPPCHAVILPSERPLIRPEKRFVEPLTAFRQESICASRLSMPPKRSLFLDIFLEPFRCTRGPP